MSIKLPSVRVPGQSSVANLCRGVSRLFVFGSLAVLGLGGVWLLTHPGAEVALMGAATQGGSHEAVGLSYSGLGGFVLLVVQGLLVVGASLAAKGRGRVRKVGLGLLLGWAALWLANGVWLAGVSDQFMRLLGAWILTGAFGATLIRVLIDWPRRETLEREAPKRGPSWVRLRGRGGRDVAPAGEVEASPDLSANPTAQVA
jgi:hypothetical protein